MFRAPDVPSPEIFVGSLAANSAAGSNPSALASQPMRREAMPVKRQAIP